MHIHRLSLQAVGPYPGTHTINFDDFEASGKFLLTGPTGSGKTTIIDAIVFALYGNVADDDSSTDRIRSTFADPSTETVVALEFSTPNGMFRIRRTPAYQRPKKRGTGLVTEKPTVAMWSINELDGDGLGTPLVRVDEVSRKVLQIVGLTREQFTQTVVLPQGKFAKFLRSSSEERHGLLRDVFGTVTYDEMQHYLEEQSKDARRRSREADTSVALTVQSLSTMLERFDQAEQLQGDTPYASLIAVANGQDVSLEPIDQDANASPEDNDEAPSNNDDSPAFTDLSDYHYRSMLSLRVTGVAQFLLQRVEHAQSAFNVSHQAFKDAQARFTDARDLVTRQERLARLRTSLNELNSQAKVMDELKELIDRAHRAQNVLDGSRAFERAGKDFTAAKSAVDGLADDPHAEKYPDVLQAKDTEARHTLVNDLNDEVAALKPVLKQAASLESLVAAVTAAHEQVESSKATYDAALQSAQDFPSHREALEKEKAEQQVIAAGLEQALTELNEVKQRHKAAHDVVAIGEKIAALQPEYEKALSQQHELLEAKTAVHQRWIDAQAGLLAQALDNDSPCPVCGSTNHPDPALLPDDNDISQEIVDTADQSYDTAQAHTHSIATQLENLRQQQDSQRDLSQGLSPEKVNEELQAAAQAHEACVVAGKAAASVDEQLKKLTAEEQASSQTTSEAKDAWTGAVQAATLAEQKLNDTRTLIDEHRQGFETLEERYQDVTVHYSWAKRVVDSYDQYHLAQEALSHATDDLTLLCENNGYESIEAARPDVLPKDDLAAHVATHSTYTTDVKAVKQQLSDPTLVGVDELPTPDCDALATVVERQRIAEEQASAVLSTLRSQHDTASSMIHQLEEAIDEADRSRAEHADLIYVASLVTGDNAQETSLGTWVLMNRFEDVVTFANDRLMTMSNGRYSLRRVHRESGSSKRKGHGLGLEVIDLFSENEQARDPRTLSGGETFYVSLSLALALADVVSAESGGIHLETLFIDEGFGSLDPHTLSAVMHELDQLREGGRIIGLVSHVEELKREIADRIEVTSTENGSTLRVIAGN
ncbi:AAA family ATPase [Actinomyces vulturis]|uniref:AAA family ATPase n=1 Tax=Actinomyces vulturis TaxID=1857645 RepID=UPI000830E2FE|nr:SMC family ATPase [Actinomyces vulturis]